MQKANTKRVKDLTLQDEQGDLLGDFLIIICFGLKDELMMRVYMECFDHSGRRVFFDNCLTYF